MNDNLGTFKFEIIKYTIIITVIFLACSIPVLGFSAEFLCGLFAGTAVSVMSLLIMIYAAKRTVESGVKWVATLGYLIRLPMYGVVVILCLKIGGLTAGIGCLIGFMTLTVSVIFIHGIKAKFSQGRTVRPEVLAEYEREDRERELRKEGIEIEEE